MTLSTHDSLVYLMVIAASSDDSISESELLRITGLVGILPVFEGFDRGRLVDIANESIDLLRDTHSLERVLDMVIAAIPERLHDTAYGLAVEVVSVDLDLTQEELRMLEMIRDRLVIDRLTTAAIEAATRARLRRA